MKVLKTMLLNWTIAKILITSGLSLLVYWLFWRWTHRRMLELAKKVPGPRAWPFVGNTLLVMANPEEQLSKIEELMKKYGEYVKFWLGPDLNICVKNPTDVRYLLTSNKVNHKGPLYNFLVPFIGQGILSGGPTWRIHRKIATPSYNKRSVQIFGYIFNKESEILARTLRNKDPSVTFDVYFDVVKCTTQCVLRHLWAPLISETLMGLSKNDALNVKKLEEVVLQTQRMYSLIFSKMTRWWLQLPFVYYLTGGAASEKYFVKAVDDLSSDIVAKRRRALKSDMVNEEGMGIVDRYILDGGLTEEEIKMETFTLFTTSQEASAKIASAVLLFLAHMPVWQEKVYNEIVTVLGHFEDVTEEDVKKLQYLDMVYKEVLRYLSIAALIQRTVDEEITVNDGKITLPAGTSLVIPIHDLHRDPRYWDEPHRVMPERFLPENVKKRDPNAFVPFSLGSMDCLGRVYATALVKTLVVRVLRQVQLDADGNLEDLELHVAISVKFAKGYNLRARPRKHGYQRSDA